MRELYTNGVATQLNGSITNTATSLTVFDASTWPAKGFRLICESEVLFCTSRSGNTLTVTRGHEGTTAASHGGNTPINHVMTGGTLRAFEREQFIITGQKPDDDLGPDDDYFEGNSLDPSWVHVGSTSPAAVVSVSNGRFHGSIPTGTAGGYMYAWLKPRTPVAGDYVQAGLRMVRYGDNYPQFGVLMADGTTFGTSNCIEFIFAAAEELLVFRYQTNFQNNTDQQYEGNTPYFCPTLHMRFVYRGSNQYDTQVSADGITWATQYANATRGSIGSITHMGFGCIPWGSGKVTNFEILYCRFGSGG